jgi:hypothetical protein
MVQTHEATLGMRIVVQDVVCKPGFLRTVFSKSLEITHLTGNGVTKYKNESLQSQNYSRNA